MIWQKAILLIVLYLIALTINKASQLRLQASFCQKKDLYLIDFIQGVQWRMDKATVMY